MAALARIAVAQGRSADAARQLQEVISEPALSRSERAWTLMSSAWLALEDARPLQALEDVKAAGHDLPEGDRAWCRLDALMAEAFLRAGAQPEALASAARALVRATGASDLSSSARARRLQAEVAAASGQLDQAEQNYRASIDDAERASDPYELGQSLLSLGLFIRRHRAGRTEDSTRQPFSLAKTWFSSIGADGKVREVDLYLERMGGKASR